MKFVVSSSLLSSRLQVLSRVINAKNSYPILEYFLFDVRDNRLSITASDGEVTLDAAIEVVDCDAPCRLAVSSKTLLDVIKEIPEQPITFEVNPDNNEITLLYMNGQFKMMGQNADEYPLPVQLNESKVRINLPADMLASGIACSQFAMDDDTMRPIMNGIYFDIAPEEVTLVASDGRKLVRCRNFAVKCGDRAAFILPKKPVSLLKMLLSKEQEEVTVEFDNRNVIFTLVNYQMVCRQIEGRYPNYNAVIPQNNPNRATVDRQALLSAVRRVAISSPSTSLVKLHLQENSLQVSAQDINFATSAQEQLTCQYDGMPLSIGFAANFLADILSNVPGQEAVLELADASRAGVIVPAEQEEGSEVLMLLMPMMLND